MFQIITLVITYSSNTHNVRICIFKKKHELWTIQHFLTITHICMYQREYFYEIISKIKMLSAKYLHLFISIYLFIYISIYKDIKIIYKD